MAAQRREETLRMYQVCKEAQGIVNDVLSKTMHTPLPPPVNNEPMPDMPNRTSSGALGGGARSRPPAQKPAPPTSRPAPPRPGTTSSTPQPSVPR